MEEITKKILFLYKILKEFHYYLANLATFDNNKRLKIVDQLYLIYTETFCIASIVRSSFLILS